MKPFARAAFPAVTLALVAACRQAPERAPAQSPAASPPAVAAATPAPATGAETALRFEGLGSHTRKISTTVAEAQIFFDQGLAFLYAFNHDEAIRSFRRAAELDPKAAMPWWGIALANGPHINNPVVPPERSRAAVEALGRASAGLATATAVERALVEAAATRYTEPQPEDRSPLERAYADAMREVWKTNPDDADVGALYAEALMDLRPWDLWTPDGKPQPGTEEVLAVLEAVRAKSPLHPLAAHLYIHAVEASPEPGKADAAADVLRDLQPGLGHLVHMPSHIDVRRGRWDQAIVQNAKAMEADRKYRERVPRQDFYRIYMAHNHHMLTFAAMMTGQGELARTTIRQMVDGIPEDWLKANAMFADGFAAMPLEVAMRFGRWDEILAMPEPAEWLPLSRSLRLAARAIAHAAKGDAVAARAEQKAFVAAQGALPEGATFGNNPARAILVVASHLVEGEVLYREGRTEAALAALGKAVEAEDALRYDEPPDWINPTRHALGAALLQSGRFPEAEAVYRKDLERLPDNGWALFGLARSLRLQKKDAEAVEVEARFATRWSKADVKLNSSCFCQPGV